MFDHTTQVGAGVGVGVKGYRYEVITDSWRDALESNQRNFEIFNNAKFRQCQACPYSTQQLYIITFQVHSTLAFPRNGVQEGSSDGWEMNRGASGLQNASLLVYYGYGHCS